MTTGDFGAAIGIISNLVVDRTDGTDYVISISFQINRGLMETGSCCIRTLIGRIVDHYGAGFGTFIGDRQEARGCEIKSKLDFDIFGKKPHV